MGEMLGEIRQRTWRLQRRAVQIQANGMKEDRHLRSAVPQLLEKRSLLACLAQRQRRAVLDVVEEVGRGVEQSIGMGHVLDVEVAAQPKTHPRQVTHGGPLR